VPSQAAVRDEFIRVWALNGGARCVLATVWGFLELRLVQDDTVVRRGVYTNFRRALAAAQQWRADWETEQSLCQPGRTRIGCPRCGAGLPNPDRPRLMEWFWCRSCGHVWVLHRRVCNLSGPA
jgi:hypothetical protein